MAGKLVIKKKVSSKPVKTTVKAPPLSVAKNAVISRIRKIAARAKENSRGRHAETGSLARALKQLSGRITALINLDTIADVLLESLMAHLHVENATLIVPEDKGSMLAIRYGRTTDGVEIKEKVGKNHHLLEWGETARHATAAHPILAPESLSAAIPLIFKGRSVGIIGLGRRTPDKSYTEAELWGLTELAHQSAIAIENAMAVRRERDYVRRLSRVQARAEYAAVLERTNQELRETQDKLLQSERVSSISRIAVSLQHEINNPLTAVLATIQLLRIKMEKGDAPDPKFITERLDVAEKEARRIRRLVHNLQSLTDPIVKEYLPGVEMIDIESLRGHEKT